MKILLTGATGQLGHEILKTTPKEIEIINPGRDELDLSDYESCKKIVLKTRPDWIINCGAYTAVDAAEKDFQICKKINSFAPQAFSEVINETNSKLLQISTDFVFNGEQNFPYQENQEKKPLSEYGKSKALGEELIEKNIKNIENANILRTSWVISPRGKNFILTMLKLHSEKESISVVYDQIGSPTSAKELSKVCWQIIKFRKTKKLPFILHWSDAGVASWYDLAIAVGEIGLELGLIEKKAFVNPIKTKDYPLPARRPKYSILDTQNTSRLLEMSPSHWRINLYDILNEYKKINKK